MTVEMLKELLENMPADYRVDVYCDMYINQAKTVEKDDIRKLCIISD